MLNRLNNSRFHNDNEYVKRRTQELMKFILNSPLTMEKTKKGKEYLILVENISKQDINELTPKQISCIENAYELCMKLAGFPATSVKHDIKRKY